MANLTFVTHQNVRQKHPALKPWAELSGYSPMAKYALSEER